MTFLHLRLLSIYPWLSSSGTQSQRTGPRIMISVPEFAWPKKLNHWNAISIHLSLPLSLVQAWSVDLFPHLEFESIFSRNLPFLPKIGLLCDLFGFLVSSFVASGLDSIFSALELCYLVSQTLGWVLSIYIWNHFYFA